MCANPLFLIAIVPRLGAYGIRGLLQERQDVAQASGYRKSYDDTRRHGCGLSGVGPISKSPPCRWYSRSFLELNLHITVSSFIGLTSQPTLHSSCTATTTSIPTSHSCRYHVNTRARGQHLVHRLLDCPQRSLCLETDPAWLLEISSNRRLPRRACHGACLFTAVTPSATSAPKRAIGGCPALGNASTIPCSLWIDMLWASN